MKLSIVLGTRPEVIKLAPVIRAARAAGHEIKVVLTGQHRHMALPLLRFFGIEPDLDLDVMLPNQTLTTLSARLLQQMDANKEAIRADYLLVQGDTTSAFVASYWAFCNNIPVGHVEAGLRTYDLTAPFPEEANRQLIGRLAQLHFAPTAPAAEALRKENVPDNTIFNVGNTAIDSLKLVLRKLDQNEVPASERLPANVKDFIGAHEYVLITAHRRESFGATFEGLCQGILRVAEQHPELRFVYPVHPNPNVREPVQKLLKNHPRILLCAPLSYISFVEVMKKAKLLLTDSGGVQEEGPTLRKPILVMRDTTERPEGVKAGFARLVGTNPDVIEREAARSLRVGCEGQGENPYGDGEAATRIIGIIEKSQI